MSSFRTRFVLALICGASLNTPVLAQTHPGTEPYSVTKIQWLFVLAQACFRHDATTDQPYALSILPGDSETLIVRLRYDASLDQLKSNQDREMERQATRNGMMMNFDVTTASVKQMAKALGWNWLKVKEDVKNNTQAMSEHH